MKIHYEIWQGLNHTDTTQYICFYANQPKNITIAIDAKTPQQYIWPVLEKIDKNYSQGILNGDINL